jgi:small membrane protein
MLILFQLLLILFSLYAIWGVLRRKKDGTLSLRGTGFWVVFWLTVIVSVIWPNSTQALADRIGIGRGSDLVIYISIVLLFFLIFKLHIKLESINRDVTKVVRKKALESADNRE